MAPPNYEEFFQRATGNMPYDYQRKLAEAADWPLAVSVGTGLGKTAAVSVAWIWRRRFADEKIRRTTPRRLVYCLPQRSLVYQTKESIQSWLRNLGLAIPEADAIGSGAVDKLGGRQLVHPEGAPIPVYVLMGGETRGDWDVHPEQDAILVGTQDQLLSRALNRGYSMSRFRWPMHYALLNQDCLWVVDEPQLFGADALATTAQLQAFRQKFGTFGRTQTVWMSATFQMDWLYTVDFAEIAKQGRLLVLPPEDLARVRKRREAPKPVVDAPLILSKEALLSKGTSKYASALAEFTLALHQPQTVTLVICNRVARAQAVYEALRKLGKDKSELMLLHSRYRQVDRVRLNEELLSLQGRDCIVVATQAVEAGIDISAETLVTELAPWASLVQRFGRCNRDGKAKSPSVSVIDVELEPACCVPYEVDELAAAKRKMAGLGDVGIQYLPVVDEKMKARYVIRRRDLLNLFDTTPDLTGRDIDISPYIRSGTQQDVEVFWRAWEGDRPTTVNHKPSTDEICHVSMSMFRDYLDKTHKGQQRVAWTWDILSGEWKVVTKDTIYPGQTILLNARFGGYSTELGFLADDWTPVPIDEALTSRIQLEAHDGENDNASREIAQPVTLSEHTSDVIRHANRLADQLHQMSPFEHVLEAARYHDWGKLHEVFQEKLRRNLPQNRDWSHQFLAKGAGVDKSDYLRKGFRHELASALAYLQTRPMETRNNDDVRLVAYLIAAHHGKIRLSIRSVPTEEGPPLDKLPRGAERPLFARGVWEGDVLPAYTLEDGFTFPQVALSLAVLEMGGSGDRNSHGTRSWTDGALACLQALGPFRLAWLETMLRVADWRASAEEAEHHASAI
ncbi:CRISPR-associated helicase Cas3' [Alicyclobacillus cycloheptanicus]|uniref:CRISPR-associated endonuclease/helicase Cas3 n=1 Tax=Alicyclobacillus cycloheptanicus TaxID=1457 RepID=A0ABT9XHP3_9BACL|nr:CRISPR-associated helicase Cas3' [Alicyclobacillus cycloheptanicus]MDQ0189635.1 CRISPR-associated endonuclease/helicase Cas3 [Alicyclobacillus cycloheptanicus]WDL99940.1 CRISPR-associated helicase Cas3' [Alicyclobacillus cycloheptanicus]